MKKPKAPKCPKPVSFKDVSTLAMTCGNEKRFSKVIHDKAIKQWVGFGWVTEGLAKPSDYLKYPEVR